MATDDPIHILVDADACPVKEEIYRVAERQQGARSVVVSNSPFRVPVGRWSSGWWSAAEFDAADDWIAERADRARSVVTSRHPARRPLPQGRGDGCWHRTGGRSPTPRSAARSPRGRSWPTCARGGRWESAGRRRSRKADRSRFLQALDEALVRLSG
jgi:uncharacterized protein YaiI (UPF0178 family)